MQNILTILRHEYITRVTKKSFIIMTLLGPVLIAAFYGAIFMLSYYQMNETKDLKVCILDEASVLNEELENSSGFEFSFVKDTVFSPENLNKHQADILLEISATDPDSISIISKSTLSINDKQKLKSIIQDAYFGNELAQRGLTGLMIDSLKHSVYMSDKLITGKDSATEIKSAIGYIGAFIIYLFIFMYGVMIMRGVTEEKNNRIVEIIISTVKPFQLMMGKILGVALVGLTQFIAWIFLSGVFVVVISAALGAEIASDAQALSDAGAQISKQADPGMMGDILRQFSSLNFSKLIVGFILFFFGGFLLYSSLFAAIGSAVDSDTETQQFMFPVSLPLIFGLVIAQIAVIKDPNSTLAIWSSMIPFTSPVVMMVRIPFDVSWVELLGSAAILFSSFVVMVWLAGKIYRIGILSYGVKASYKQMIKWLISS